MKYYLVVLCSLAYFLSSACFAREPIQMESVLSSARLQGSGRLTWWGFDIYDAALYRAGTLSSSEFALDFRYQKSFTGVAIANSTAEEMKK